MNSLKTLFVVAVLAAVAYGVYVSINRNPEAANVLDDAPAWPGSPKVQIPGPEAATPQFSDGTSGTVLGQRSPLDPTAVAGSGAATMNSPMTPRLGSPNLGSHAATAPPFAVPGASPPPVEIPAEAAASPYPYNGYPVPATKAASPGALPLASSIQPSPGTRDGPGLRSDSPRALNPTPPAATPGAEKANPVALRFSSLMASVQSKLDEGGLAQAHLALSLWYGNPDLPPDQAGKLTDLLDQLAGTVIYSRRHLLEPPYEVQAGDTLEQIAQTYEVPWLLLARINGLRDSQDLRPGQQLKVVRGPFSALVDLDAYELTLMLKGRYAGRFPIGVGREQAKLEGSYVVCNQTVGPQYYGPGGVTIAGDDPNNPLGEFWIGLGERAGQGSRIGIHGTNDSNNLHRTTDRGSICLGDQDLRDVFGILSIGSRVVIQR